MIIVQLLFILYWQIHKLSASWLLVFIPSWVVIGQLAAKGLMGYVREAHEKGEAKRKAESLLTQVRATGGLRHRK